ncbi:hypothetical protein HDV05_007346 [Chytridiales sp. JEL 0842]|nr:hypothetical protein HDV05_007346 [Chytridiales sp. JEL 0842]
MPPTNTLLPFSYSSRSNSRRSPIIHTLVKFFLATSILCCTFMYVSLSLSPSSTTVLHRRNIRGMEEQPLPPSTKAVDPTETHHHSYDDEDSGFHHLLLRRGLDAQGNGVLVPSSRSGWTVGEFGVVRFMREEMKAGEEWEMVQMDLYSVAGGQYYYTTLAVVEPSLVFTEADKRVGQWKFNISDAFHLGPRYIVKVFGHEKGTGKMISLPDSEIFQITMPGNGAIITPTADTVWYTGRDVDVQVQLGDAFLSASSVRVELTAAEMDYTYILVPSIPINSLSTKRLLNATFNLPVSFRKGQTYFLSVAANDGPEASERVPFPGGMSSGLIIPSTSFTIIESSVLTAPPLILTLPPTPLTINSTATLSWSFHPNTQVQPVSKWFVDIYTVHPRSPFFTGLRLGEIPGSGEKKFQFKVPSDWVAGAYFFRVYGTPLDAQVADPLSVLSTVFGVVNVEREPNVKLDLKVPGNWWSGAFVNVSWSLVSKAEDVVVAGYSLELYKNTLPYKLLTTLNQAPLSANTSFNVIQAPKGLIKANDYQLRLKLHLGAPYRDVDLGFLSSAFNVIDPPPAATAPGSTASNPITIDSSKNGGSGGSGGSNGVGAGANGNRVILTSTAQSLKSRRGVPLLGVKKAGVIHAKYDKVKAPITMLSADSAFIPPPTIPIVQPPKPPTPDNSNNANASDQHPSSSTIMSSNTNTNANDNAHPKRKNRRKLLRLFTSNSPKPSQTTPTNQQPKNPVISIGLPAGPVLKSFQRRVETTNGGTKHMSAFFGGNVGSNGLLSPLSPLSPAANVGSTSPSLKPKRESSLMNRADPEVLKLDNASNAQPTTLVDSRRTLTNENMKMPTSPNRTRLNEAKDASEVLESAQRAGAYVRLTKRPSFSSIFSVECSNSQRRRKDSQLSTTSSDFSITDADLALKMESSGISPPPRQFSFETGTTLTRPHGAPTSRHRHRYGSDLSFISTAESDISTGTLRPSKNSPPPSNTMYHRKMSLKKHYSISYSTPGAYYNSLKRKPVSLKSKPSNTSLVSNTSTIRRRRSSSTNERGKGKGRKMSDVEFLYMDPPPVEMVPAAANGAERRKRGGHDILLETYADIVSELADMMDDEEEEKRRQHQQQQQARIEEEGKSAVENLERLLAGLGELVEGEGGFSGSDSDELSSPETVKGDTTSLDMFKDGEEGGAAVGGLVGDDGTEEDQGETVIEEYLFEHWVPHDEDQDEEEAEHAPIPPSSIPQAATHSSSVLPLRHCVSTSILEKPAPLQVPDSIKLNHSTSMPSILINESSLLPSAQQMGEDEEFKYPVDNLEEDLVQSAESGEVSPVRLSWGVVKKRRSGYMSQPPPSASQPTANAKPAHSDTELDKRHSEPQTRRVSTVASTLLAANHLLKTPTLGRKVVSKVTRTITLDRKRNESKVILSVEILEDDTTTTSSPSSSALNGIPPLENSQKVEKANDTDWSYDETDEKDAFSTSPLHSPNPGSILSTSHEPIRMPISTFPPFLTSGGSPPKKGLELGVPTISHVESYGSLSASSGDEQQQRASTKKPSLETCECPASAPPTSSLLGTNEKGGCKACRAGLRRKASFQPHSLVPGVHAVGEPYENSKDEEKRESKIEKQEKVEEEAPDGVEVNSKRTSSYLSPTPSPSLVKSQEGLKLTLPSSPLSPSCSKSVLSSSEGPSDDGGSGEGEEKAVKKKKKRPLSKLFGLVK